MGDESSPLTDNREFGLNARRRACPRMSWPTFWLASILCVFLLSCPVNSNAQTPTEALFQAVELNDIAAVEAAIEGGANLAETNPDGMTAADVAVDLGHFRIAHLLLAKRTAAPPSARVTENARTALTSPRGRVAAPTQRATAPTSRLSSVRPPTKPTPPPLVAQPQPEVPAQVAPPALDADPQGPIDTTPLPDDEIATSTPSENVPVAASPDPAKDDGGFLDGIWGGIKSVATLGGLLGGEEEPVGEPAPGTYVARDPNKFSPADRFSRGGDAAGGVTERGSSAGRMVDRLTGIVGGNQTEENEFGLPTSPVVPPVSSPGGNTDLAELAPPEIPLDEEITLPPGVITIPADDPLPVPSDPSQETLPPPRRPFSWR